jgi:nicotinate dehydrogenase subunit A
MRGLHGVARRSGGAKDLLDQNPHPNAAQVREALAGNLCRCGTHNRIIRAVLRAAQNMRKS